MFKYYQKANKISKTIYKKPIISLSRLEPISKDLQSNTLTNLCYLACCNLNSVKFYGFCPIPARIDSTTPFSISAA